MALLLREAIGGTIRRARTERARTLRDVSRDARVSLGYLSEIERGRKEPSSELLAAICDALSLPLPDLLDDVADALRPQSARRPAVPARIAGPRLVGVDAAAPVEEALRTAVEEAFETTAAADEPAAAPSGTETAPATGEVVDLLETPDGSTGVGFAPGDETTTDDAELRLVELVTVGGPVVVVRAA